MNTCGKLLFFLIFFTTICNTSLLAQKKVKLVQAESLESGERNGEKFNKVLKDVIFKQKQTTIYCDSAYFFKKRNYIEAFGHVKITEGDSVVITSKKLIYDGETKIAKLRDNVVFTDGIMTLYTEFLDYKINQGLAFYFNDGKMVDSTNVLTSNKGYYQTNIKMASFKKEVELNNPEFKLKSDSMQYHTITKIAYFRSPTEIIAKDGSTLNAMGGGEYNTISDQSQFKKGEVETDNYIISGDKLFSDETNKLYTATKNVVMTAKKDQVIITGELADYKKKEGITKIFGNPVLRKIDGKDTLYISADTLVSIEGSVQKQNKMIAYHNVKIYKKDLQAKTDSLTYNFMDSTIYLYNDPVLWSGDAQMTADSVNIQMAYNKVDKMNLTLNSFIISQDTVENYNQIKGRNMVIYFRNDMIHKVDVKGNGESIYFPLDADIITMGLNKIICSDMLIRFKENKVDNITFYINPDASFIPPHEVTETDLKLKNFRWRSEERPDLDITLRKRKPQDLPQRPEIQKAEAVEVKPISIK